MVNLVVKRFGICLGLSIRVLYGGERRRSVERFGERLPLNELVFVGVFVESLFEGRRKAAVSRAFLESLSLNGLGLVGVLSDLRFEGGETFRAAESFE